MPALPPAADPELPGTSPEWGVYIHAPWCLSRCAYCAFNVYTSAPAWAAWAAGLREGLARSAPHFPGRAHQLYFGGGTPSLAPPELVGELIRAVDPLPGAEVSLEANPGTVDARRVDALVQAGVNRLSLGVQTFHPAHARRLQRRHSPDEARALLGAVARAGLRSWSFDLIFALPDQTLDELRFDLDQLLACDPPHVSLYALSFEPGTPFTRALERGQLQALDEDAQADQLELITATLQAAGYERYEVSNFAKPGHRGRHNESTWRGNPYMGLGPGAHGFRPDGARTVGAAAFEAWLQAPEGALSWPDPEQAALDLMLCTLRHIDGLPLAALAARGFRLDPAAVAPLVGGGWLREAEGHLRLTDAGAPLVDALLRRLRDGLRPLATVAGRA